MTDDVNEQPLEDLEVSVRTAELLQPRGRHGRRAPRRLRGFRSRPPGPRRSPYLVEAELAEALEELGVTFAGEITAPAPREAKLTATGDVRARWTTIAAWLEAEHPSALAHWKPPATEAQIAAAEQKLGVTFPATTGVSPHP